MLAACSDFLSEAMVWIKELEMVDSMEELKSSRSVAGKNFPNVEMLDAKIASAFNKIIQNSHFEKKVSLEEQKAQKEDRFLRGRQIAFMIRDYIRVTGAHDTVLDYADLLSVTLRDDNIQEFDTRWDEILLSMSKIPSDDVLESLHKLRIRVFDRVKTVLELYDMEIHQKISIARGTPFLTRCHVWEASVQNQFKLGKTKLNGIWRHATSKNWIKLMENRWNSSGEFSQDSPHREFSLR